MMKTKILNYRVLVEKEKQANKVVYVAYASSLGISDFGSSVEQAVNNLRKAIYLYLKTLLELKKPIPAADEDDFYVTIERIELKLPPGRMVYC